MIAGVVMYLLIQALFVGIADISGSSEAREAQVVDVIAREGTWILPLRNGIIPSKPPLYHWLASCVSMVSGGVSEFSTRYTSQLCAAICLIAVAIISYRFANATRSDQASRHARRSALLSAAILSLTYGFYQLGCQAMVDMTFTCCVWLAFASVALGSQATFGGKAPVSELGRTFFWFFCGLAALARGPIGMLLPIALVGAAGWCALGLTATLKSFLRPSFGWGALVIPLTWYYLAFDVGGEAFLERQLFFENVRRFSGGEFVNSEAWWFYLPSVIRTTFPWGIILLGIAIGVIQRPKTLSYPGVARRVRWLPSIMLCVGIALLSLSSGKRHSYLLPLFPLIALQLGVELSTFFERGGERARVRAARVGRTTEITLVTVSMLVLLAIGIFGEYFAATPGYLRDSYSVLSTVIGRLSILILLCTLVAFIGLRRQITALYGSVWFLMLVLMTGSVAAGATVKSHLKGFKQIATAWLATAKDTENLAVFKGAYDEYFDPILYYVHRRVRIVSLDAVENECEAGTVYAAKRAWLDPHEGLFQGQVVRVLTVRERFLASKGDGIRDLVFFRCGDYGGSQGRLESPRMQDAVYHQAF
jgi:4-amino-4-deoxy-L-arabinose transferase-like glycosyltransferase